MDKKHIWAIILIVLFLFMGFFTTSIGSKERGPGEDKVGAYIISQEFVKNRLSTPTTAEFPYPATEVKYHEYKDTYTVWSYVDYQNKYGAFIRKNYTAEVREGTNYEGGEGWELIELDFY